MKNRGVLLLNKENIQTKDITNTLVKSSVQSVPDTLMHRGLGGEVYAHAFFYSSDVNLKENINQLEESSIDNLVPVTFTWKDTGKKDVGFIAQQVNEALPEAVIHNDTLSISLTPIVAHLVKEVQELKQKIKDLESKE